MLSKIWRLSLE